MTSQEYGPLLIALAAAVSAGVFALRWRRAGAYTDLARLGRFGRDCLDAIVRESEQRARVAIVKWGVAGVLGVAGIATGGVVAAKYAPLMPGLLASMSPRIYQLDMATGGGETLDWFCDWRLSTGSDSASIRGVSNLATTPGLSECFNDFTAISGFGTMGETVAATGLGFPAEMTNVYRVFISDTLPQSSMMLRIQEGWDTLEVGGSLFLRSYDRLDMPVGESTNTHIVHIGKAGTPYSFWWVSTASVVAADSSYNLDAELRRSTTQETKWRDTANVIAKTEQVWRREVRLYREDLSTFFTEVRIYDPTGTEVSNANNFKCWGNCTGAYRFRIDQMDTIPSDRSVNWTLGMQGLEIGNNGNGADGSDPDFAHWYWGGMAVRVNQSDSSDWIGPYPVGPEGN